MGAGPHRTRFTASPRSTSPANARHWYTRTDGHRARLRPFVGGRAVLRRASHGVASVTHTRRATHPTYRESSGGLLASTRPRRRTAPVRDALPASRLGADRDSRPGSGGAKRPGAATRRSGARVEGRGAGRVVDVGPGRYTTRPASFPARRDGGCHPACRGRLAPRASRSGGRHARGGARRRRRDPRRVTVTGGSPGLHDEPADVRAAGWRRMVVRDCHVESIAFTAGTGPRVAGNVMAGGEVWLIGHVGLRGPGQLSARAAVGCRYQDHGRRRPCRSARTSAATTSSAISCAGTDGRPRRAQSVRDLLVGDPPAQCAHTRLAVEPGLAHDARGPR